MLEGELLVGGEEEHEGVGGRKEEAGGVAGGLEEQGEPLGVDVAQEDHSQEEGLLGGCLEEGQEVWEELGLEAWGVGSRVPQRRLVPVLAGVVCWPPERVD